MKREWSADEPEWMDRPQPVSDELRRDLIAIGDLNRRFVAHKLVSHYLHRVLQPGGCYRILDLCSGFGDIPRMMIDWGRRNRIALQIDAIEAHPATLEIAREHSRDYPELSFHHGDALTYCPSSPYDLVHCSLSLHHFSDTDAVRLLRQCRELSRRWVLITDLTRSRLAQAVIWATTALLCREPMTRHDARLSIRRAFSAKELLALAHQAQWPPFEHRRIFPERQALWLDVGP